MISSNHLTRALVSLAIALPWLNPFAPGPFPPALQWVVTLVCGALVLAWWAWQRPTAAELGQAASNGFLVAALVSSAIGLCQYLGWSEHFYPWMNTSPLGQAYANLRQRNQFATLCNMGLACLMWARFSLTPVAQPVPRGTSHDTPHVATWLMAALLGLGNATSSSRTGFFQWLLIGLCLLVWHRLQGAEASDARAQRRERWTVYFVASAAFGVGLFMLPRLLGLDPTTHGLLGRIGGDADPCNSRVALWNNVLYLISLKPWTGWGWGELGFAHYSVLQPQLRFCDILDNAHNLFLQLAVEVGVPITLGVALLLLWFFVRGRPHAEQNPTRQAMWVAVLLILLHSMLEYPLWYGPFLTAAVLAAVVLWPWRHSDTANTSGGQRSVAPVAALAAALVLAAAAYMAWEYRRVSQIFLPQEERAPAYQSHTLEKIRDNWLFRRYVKYAELTTTPVTEQSAPRVRELALAVLHFSAEPRVIEKLLDSTVLLGDNDELLAHMARYEAAFPKEYRRWRAGLSDPADNE